MVYNIIKMEITDCLVLRITEFDVDHRANDSDIFVIYDKNEHQFIIRGTRIASKPTRKHTKYAFNCEFAEELADFISFVICSENQVTYELYNYDNLPATSEEITYDFMLEHVDRCYELAAYDKQTFDRKKLLTNLRMLRNVFNYYN